MGKVNASSVRFEENDPSSGYPSEIPEFRKCRLLLEMVVVFGAVKRPFEEKRGLCLNRIRIICLEFRKSYRRENRLFSEIYVFSREKFPTDATRHQQLWIV